jgi:hypothetical protein
MHCHICEKGAVGMCRQCYKFYCATHGDGFCDTCQKKGWATNQPAATVPTPARTATAGLSNLPKEVLEQLKSGATTVHIPKEVAESLKDTAKTEAAAEKAPPSGST